MGIRCVWGEGGLVVAQVRDKGRGYGEGKMEGIQGCGECGSRGLSVG